MQENTIKVQISQRQIHELGRMITHEILEQRIETRTLEMRLMSHTLANLGRRLFARSLTHPTQQVILTLSLVEVWALRRFKPRSAYRTDLASLEFIMEAAHKFEQRLKREPAYESFL